MFARFRDPYFAASVLAVVFVLTAFVYRVFFMAGTPPPTPPPVVPKLKEPGTEHSHASLLVMVGDRIVSFCDPKYMLKSPVVHFEDDNCLIVHKHARGVTLPVFFKTLDVGLTEKCLSLPGEEKKCDDGAYRLRVMWNGVEIPMADLPYREIRDNDRILLNFGPEEGAMLKFKWNQVEPVPDYVRTEKMDAPPTK